MVQSSAKGGRGRRLAICEDLDAPDAESVVPRAYDLLERVAPVRGGLVKILHAVHSDLQREAKGQLSARTRLRPQMW